MGVNAAPSLRLRRLPWALLAAGAAALALAGCGGRPKPRSGAEPARAPIPAHAPAGRSVSVGGAPEGIVVDARTGLVVVALRDPPALALMSARSGRLLRRLPIAGSARHLQLAAPGGPVLVPEETTAGLLELALPSLRVRVIAAGVHPHDAAAVAGRVFVADEFGHRVTIVEHGRAVGELGGFRQPGGVAAVGADVAVVDVGADTLSLFDARTLRGLGRLAAGAGPTHAAVDGGGRIRVLDTRGGALLSYSASPRLRLLGRLALPGTPYGIASDPIRHRLWVTLTARDALAELDVSGARPRVLRMFPTARQPNTVAVEEASGDVFVADAAAGTVELIRPGS